MHVAFFCSSKYSTHIEYLRNSDETHMFHVLTMADKRKSEMMCVSVCVY